MTKGQREEGSDRGAVSVHVLGLPVNTCLNNQS